MSEFTSHEYYCRARVAIPGLQSIGATCNQPVEFTAGEDPVHVDRKIDGYHEALPMTAGQAKRLAAGLSMTWPKKLERFGPAVPVGFYLKDEQIFRVTQPTEVGRQAEVLEPPEFPDENGKWIRVSQHVLYSLKGEHALTREQAAEFGKNFHICFRCGLTLKHPDSIARGMGALCADVQGWSL